MDKNQIALSSEMSKSFNIKEFSDISLKINDDKILYLHKLVLNQW